MKHKIFIFFAIFAIFAFSQNEQIVFAEEDFCDWCRITTDGTYLHKNIPSSNKEDICFKLPTSYFAEILECADDFYKVRFNEVIGYVEKNNVTKVYSTPLIPFPENITCSINESVQAVLFDIPSTSGNQVGVVPSGQKANFLGETTGEEAILGLGTEWFYVRFRDEEHNFSGFVYAPLTKNLSQIPINTEEVLLTPASAEESGFMLSPELKDVKNILIITSLCVAGSLVFLAIFLPRRKKKEPRKVLPPPKFDDFDF